MLALAVTHVIAKTVSAVQHRRWPLRQGEVVVRLVRAEPVVWEARVHAVK